VSGFEQAAKHAIGLAANSINNGWLAKHALGPAAASHKNTRQSLSLSGLNGQDPIT
jgi:hypothetical protein